MKLKTVGLSSLLLIGDSLIFLLFAFFGRYEHAETLTGPAVLKTGFPFWISWVIVSLFLKTFSRHAVSSPSAAFKKLSVSWIAACPIGLILRALFLSRGIPIAFAMVVFVVILLLLTAFRVSLSWYVSRSLRSIP